MPEACSNVVNPWHILRVKTGAEAHCFEQLQLRSIEPFLPTYTLKRRLAHRPAEELPRALFPGYLFARVDFENRVEVLRTPGVYEFLRFANCPATLTEGEVENIRRIMQTENVRTSAPLEKGMLVEICEGPLEGYVGTVIRLKNVSRVYVNIPAFNRAAVTEIDPCRLRVLPPEKKNLAAEVRRQK